MGDVLLFWLFIFCFFLFIECQYNSTFLSLGQYLRSLLVFAIISAMAQVAVFDSFYGGERVKGRPTDIVGMALEAGDHEVITHSNSIRAGALAIAAMGIGEIETPNVFIIGARIGDDADYFRNPATVSRVTEVAGKSLFGKAKVTSREITTTLLPIPLPGDDTKMVLPTSYRSPVNPKYAAAFADNMRFDLMEPGHTPYVLSHLVRLLLPEAKVIGVSAVNIMDIPHDSEGTLISAAFHRQAPNRKANAQRMHEAIVRLAAGKSLEE